MQGPSNTQSKVILGRFCQLLAINAHKMAPSAGQLLQIRVWDTTTKGLLWKSIRTIQGSVRRTTALCSSLSGLPNSVRPGPSPLQG